MDKDYLNAGQPALMIKIIRKDRGHTQRWVADQLRISPSSLSRIENGKTRVTATFWYAFCQLVQVPPEVLIFGYKDYKTDRPA